MSNLPATPANLPLNYWHPPRNICIPIHMIRILTTSADTTSNRRRNSRRKEEKEKEKKKKKELDCNSVINKYIEIEYVKQHYEINRKSQEQIIQTI